MAATFTVGSVTHLPNGEVLVRGTATLSNVYLTGGETLDLSTWLSGSPLVVANGDVANVKHNAGTAAAGKLIAYQANGGAAGLAALVQAANAADLSGVTCTVVAIGAGVQ